MLVVTTTRLCTHQLGSVLLGRHKFHTITEVIHLHQHPHGNPCNCVMTHCSGLASSESSSCWNPLNTTIARASPRPRCDLIASQRAWNFGLEAFHWGPRGFVRERAMSAARGWDGLEVLVILFISSVTIVQ